MGLLDEAIREHLELKRRRGADPGEVAREQREALDTPYAPDHLGEASGELEAADNLDLDETTGADPELPSATVGDEDLVAGETAELDMQAVLAEDAESDDALAEEDSLEWETPPRGGASHPGESPSAAAP